MNKKNLVIVLAGGSGSRISSERPKQFFELAGKTILAHTIEKFENHSSIQHIFIVTNNQYVEETREIVEQGHFKKVIKILEGGVRRQDSSRNGIMAAEEGGYENVLIHDAARPFVSGKIIDDILAALETYSAVNVAIPSADTILEIDENRFIKNVPDRKYLRRVQTPQAFKLELIRKAHQLALEKGFNNATDDCALVLKQNLAPVYVVEGSEKNIKITYPQDLLIAEKILYMVK